MKRLENLDREVLSYSFTQQQEWTPLVISHGDGIAHLVVPRETGAKGFHVKRLENLDREVLSYSFTQQQEWTPLVVSHGRWNRGPRPFHVKRAQKDFT